MASATSNFDRDTFHIDLQEGGNFAIYDEYDNELFYVGAKIEGGHEITVFTDDAQQDPAMFIRKDSWKPFRGVRYSVQTPNGEVIANLYRRSFFGNLFRAKLGVGHNWHIESEGGESIATARERLGSRTLARALLDLINITGDPNVVSSVMTDFELVRQNATGNEEIIGSYQRVGRSSDDHLLDLSADYGRILDRRIALALALLWDEIH
jgi:hypothetical protein